MAFLYVTEYAEMTTTLANGQQVLCPKEPPVVAYRIAITGASVQSPAFQKATRFVMIHPDAVCSYAFDAPAVNTANRLGQNETRFSGVIFGETVSVITNT